MNRPPEPPITPVIPDHQLIRLIGEGSYGQIWLARNVIGTYRAVKIVYRSKFDNERPYEREFKGIQKFEPISRSHPGLVDILQVGRNDDAGYFYYVMELADDEVAGREFHPAGYSAKTLGRLWDVRGRLTALESLQIGMHLASALAHMHKHELVHRDIKPSNIIFVQGQPKLADIGLVVSLTDARTFVGTEGYIAPEGPGSIQADIYSLGKVLYEISTGQDRQSFPELPNELATFDDRDLVIELNEIVVKACATSPTARYATADDLGNDVQFLLAGRSVKRLRFVERQLARTVRVAVVAVIMAIAAGGLAYGINKVRQREKQLLAASYTTSGARLLESGNLHASLPFFAEALRLEGDNAAAVATHRLRIGSVLQESPRLVQFWQHSSEAKDINFSSNGERVLVAGGQRARIVNVRSGQTESEFHTSRAIETAAFSPDNMRVAIAHGRFLAIADATSGTNIFEVETHGHIFSAEFSPDGETIALGCGDNCAHIVDARSGEPRRDFNGHRGAASYASFSPDGKLLATAGHDGTARIWNAGTGELIHSLQHAQWVYDAAFSPDGKRLVTASSDHTLRVWDVATGNEAMWRMEHRGGVRRARFSPDGRYIASASFDKTVLFWNARTGEQIPSTLNLPAPVMHAVFSPEGRYVATAGHNGEIKVWDITPSAPVHAGFGIVSANGERYVTFASNSFQAWSARDDSPLTSRMVVPEKIKTVLCSADAATIAIIYPAPTDKTSYIQIFQSNVLSRPWKTSGRVDRSFLSPDGKQLVTIHSKTAFVWRASAGELLFSPKSYTSDVRRVAFSPNGQFLLLGAGRILSAIRMRNGAELFAPIEHQLPVEDIDVAPDSSRFITVTADKDFLAGAAQVWSASNGKRLAGMPIHTDGILSGRFTANGEFVATAGEDSQAAVWKTTTGELRTEPLALLWTVPSVSFSPDDRWLLTTTWFETQVWDARTGQPVTSPFPGTGRGQASGFCDGGRRIWMQSTRGLFFWNLPRNESTPDEVISMAHHLGVTVPSELPWNREALTVPALRQLASNELARTQASMESWHRERAQLHEQDEDWFAAQFHWQQLLKRKPGDAGLQTRWEEARSRWLKSAPAGQ